MHTHTHLHIYMYPCMYICIYICICMCICIVSTYICICMHMQVHMHTHMHRQLHTHTHAHMHMYMYTYMYRCMYMYMYMYARMYSCMYDLQVCMYACCFLIESFMVDRRMEGTVWLCSAESGHLAGRCHGRSVGDMLMALPTSWERDQEWTMLQASEAETTCVHASILLFIFMSIFKLTLLRVYVFMYLHIC